MKKILLFSLAVSATFICLVSCNQAKHTISANIKGLGNDTVFVEYYPLAPVNEVEPVQDTIIASNGRFAIDLDLPNAQYMYLKFSTQVKRSAGGRELESMARMIFLVLKPGDQMVIKGSAEDANYLQYSVKGSDFNQGYASMRDAFKVESVKIDSIDLIALDGVADSILMAERTALLNKKNDAKIEFIKSNPASELSALYLIEQPIPVFGEYYPLLSEEVKKGMFSQTLSRQQGRYQAYEIRVRAEKEVVPGAQAPEFTLKDMGGNDVALSSLKGKFVVLDFWGSWCSWCIKGIPEMKRYHAKYGDRITFVGIDCYDEDAKWREAVEKYGLDWIQLVEESSNPDLSISARYAVGGFPAKIILDKDLKVVARFRGESPDFYQKLDELMKR